jgi:hypothetical protein
VEDLLKSHGLTFHNLSYTVAGSDVKIREEARGNYGPSVLEQFMSLGWFGIMVADQGRVAGYSNLLQYLHDKNLAFCDTPGNRLGVEQMLGLVVDPDAPNTILKTDVNPTTGEGGDDWTDALRYGAMSRPTYRPIATLTSKSQEHGRKWTQMKHGPQSAMAPKLPPMSLPLPSRTRSVGVE